MRILVALGGSALLRRGEPADAGSQRQDVEAAALGLAAIAAGNELAIAHGDGSRDGLLASHALGVALRNALPGREVVTVLNAVVVSPGKHPSPVPSAVAELPSLRVLVDSGALLICAAGGGIPVTLDGAGTMREVEAAIDKDLTAALLARRLDADLLLMLTDVEAVQLGWGTDRVRPLRATSPAQLRKLDFAAGSIGPKVEAACRFVEATGRRAAVGALADAERVLRGEAGTQVAPREGEPASA